MQIKFLVPFFSMLFISFCDGHTGVEINNNTEITIFVNGKTTWGKDKFTIKPKSLKVDNDNSLDASYATNKPSVFIEYIKILNEEKRKLLDYRWKKLDNKLKKIKDEPGWIEYRLDINHKDIFTGICINNETNECRESYPADCESEDEEFEDDGVCPESSGTCINPETGACSEIPESECVGENVEFTASASCLEG